MSTLVTDEARAKREARAKTAVANAVKQAKAGWGNGWLHLSETMRRGEVCRRVLCEIAVMETESAEVAVFCVAVASEAMRVEL